MRICSGAGCLRAVPDDRRFCDDCKPEAVTTDDIRNHTLSDGERYAFLYRSARWQRLRAVVIREHPMCDRCGLRVSDIADHRIPSGVAIAQVYESGLYSADRYAGFFIKSNLQGLCRPCHYLKTEEDKAHVGAWPSVLEADALSPKKVWSF